jgi:cadmium resistance protein CadD (predicted permease)
MALFVGTCALGVAAFASTNVDNLFVLCLFFSGQRFSTRDIVLGQYVAVISLYVVSAVASVISLGSRSRVRWAIGARPDSDWR